MAITSSLRAFARRALGSPEGVEDVVQETLVSALARLDTFDGRSRLSTWAIGILSHKVIDYLRSRSRFAPAPVGDIEPADLLEAPPRDRPDQAFDRRQVLEAVERALPKLPDHERLAVLMVDVQGLDRTEVCEVLEVTPENLRVILHRGRHRLRRAVENDELSARP